jgi:hypothetical protein
MMSPGGMGAAMGGILVLFWLVLMGGMVVAWIFFLVAVWRGMKAHESIAASLKRMADRQEGAMR